MMQTAPEAKFKITGRAIVYAYPGTIIPTWHEHCLIGGSLFVFPSVHYAVCKENGWIRDESDNLVVNTGLAQIILLLNGGSSVYFAFCGVGSGSSTVLPGDTDLTTPIMRLAVTSIGQSANVGTWSTFFPIGIGTGTWSEAGLFSLISAGIMLCKKLIGPFSKTSGITATVSWTITVTAV